LAYRLEPAADVREGSFFLAGAAAVQEADILYSMAMAVA